MKKTGSWKLAARSTVFEVPRDVDDNDAAVALYEEDHLEKVGAAVVEQVFPPVANYEFRHQHADFANRRLSFHFENVVDHGLHDVAVGRLQNFEFGHALARIAQRGGDHGFPVAAELVGFLAELDVQAANVSGHGEREGERLFGDAAPAIDGDDHNGLHDVGRLDGALEIDVSADVIVVTADSAHE